MLEAAFGSLRPHTVPFEKFYKGSWHLQPGIGGASTDLMPNNSSQERGYIDIHYNSALQRYVLIISNDTTFYYAESIDALNWTTPTVLGTFDTWFSRTGDQKRRGQNRCLPAEAA